MRFNRKLAALMISIPVAALIVTSGFPTAAELPCEIVIEHDGYKRDLKPSVEFIINNIRKTTALRATSATTNTRTARTCGRKAWKLKNA